MAGELTVKINVYKKLVEETEDETLKANYEKELAELKEKLVTTMCSGETKHDSLYADYIKVQQESQVQNELGQIKKFEGRDYSEVGEFLKSLKMIQNTFPNFPKVDLIRLSKLRLSTHVSSSLYNYETNHNKINSYNDFKTWIENNYSTKKSVYQLFSQALYTDLGNQTWGSFATTMITKIDLSFELLKMHLDKETLEVEDVRNMCAITQMVEVMKSRNPDVAMKIMTPSAIAARAQEMEDQCNLPRLAKTQLWVNGKVKKVPNNKDEKGENPIKTCSHCKKERHTVDKCWKLYPHLAPKVRQNSIKKGLYQTTDPNWSEKN